MHLTGIEPIMSKQDASNLELKKCYVKVRLSFKKIIPIMS